MRHQREGHVHHTGEEREAMDFETACPSQGLPLALLLFLLPRGCHGIGSLAFFSPGRSPLMLRMPQVIAVWQRVRCCRCCWWCCALLAIGF